MECPSPVRLRTLGGAVDNRETSIAGTPKFEVEEIVILFLKSSLGPYSKVLGLSQGKYSIMRRGNASYVTRDLRGLTLAEKKGGKYRLEDPHKPEWEMDLDAFLERIESYLTEKEE
jgi:hypothetical protein